MSSALFVLFPFLLVLPNVLCAPADLTFDDCFDPNANVSEKLTVSNVYAQVLYNSSLHNYLDLVVIGETPVEIIGRSDSSLNLATLFTSTSILTLSAWSNSSYLCRSIHPPDSELSSVNDTNDDYYCPIPAGPFALSAQIPWGSDRALTTLTTRLRAVDTFSNEMLCIDVETTPLAPTKNEPYGAAVAIFWGTVSLAIAYWVVVGIARIVSAWNRGISRPGKGLWERAQSAGFILASAMSGERFATSPALLRFSTPSMRDIIFHTQWCSVLAMVAVQWPAFVYPLLTQTAWATLSYNITLTSGSDHHWDPLSTASYNPPSDFQSQMSNSSNDLYINSSIPNILFMLPTNATTGMEAFAYSVGVRPQDLFGICLILFLGIAAAAVALSALLWFVDYLAGFLGGAMGSSHSGMKHLGGTRSPAFGSKDMLDSSAVANATAEENRSLNGKDALGIIRPPSRYTLGSTGATGMSSRKPWWRIRTSLSSFHGSVLHGNLVRILILFHLPVTVFSVYQMTLPRSRASMASIVLAGCSFAILSVLIPTILVIRVRMTTTSKLYDETRTLLSLGPLYNHYRHGSQMFAGLFFATNVAFGLTIGAGQHSGTAQAIVILVVEVVSALVTSIWLPWGNGASMGLISFLFCVGRIVVAVLLLILTPALSIGAGAGGWVAYGVLVILALVYLALFLMLVVKFVEALVRIVGMVGFERSSHIVDSGLLGACGLAGCCGSRKRRRPRRSNDKKPQSGKVLPRYDNADSKHIHKRDSDVSSYMPPGSLGTAVGAKGSVSSGPPPSVLKPEHALRPYREESDDENGYIMGAWQPFQTKASGYIPVNDTPTKAPPTSSGFSRVGGGRAHIDSPYAITAGSTINAGSTQTFPSIPHQVPQPTQPNASTGSLKRPDDDDDTPSLSANTAVRQQQEYHARTGSLPPGAMPPFHVRTKSQTAIIEHAGGVNQAGPSYPTGPAIRPVRDPTPPPTAFNLRHSNPGPDDDYGSDTDVPKKKPWYHLRRHRPHSSEGTSSTAKPPEEDTPPNLAPASTSAPQRSFVVIRKPQQSPARSQKLSTGSEPANLPPSAADDSSVPTRRSYPSRPGSSGAGK
ncbi:uncharacterized protein BT62DRAFT_892081 [Guyanagaster necrorhizus]|uniref:TRP C-terminal domain-containing protein n=1 Tax=Guyanagaster necrorhizus TaxID=856835 RepID=A0A9P7VUE5_9AGAR|nr:uncharacterized protein BT62DRAFT_892081 [Guyanagaster necrorhizus MCA 3950]KAG7447646.1 hypothetical protein BT62DRAFT_892081 [Guyanagaster necrorhizus MCA 3950]